MLRTHFPACYANINWMDRIQIVGLNGRVALSSVCQPLCSMCACAMTSQQHENPFWSVRSADSDETQRTGKYDSEIYTGLCNFVTAFLEALLAFGGTAVSLRPNKQQV